MMSKMQTVRLGALVALLAVACGDNTSTSTTATSTTSSTAQTTVTTAATTTAPPATPAQPTTTVPVEKIVVATYFSRAGLLVAGSRTVAKGDALRAAVAAVVEGPSAAERDAGFTSAVPNGTALRGVAVNGRQAEVDLSSAFASGGGSLSMRLRVAQIVYTVMRLGPVDSVRFLIEGQRVESIGGEGFIVTGVKIEEFDDLLPPIIVEFPTPGATVSPGFAFKGLANVFEGHVSYELFDARGNLLSQGFATGMMGAWGPFSASVTYAAGVAGRLVLSVFTVSPKDGSRRDESRTSLVAG